VNHARLHGFCLHIIRSSDNPELIGATGGSSQQDAKLNSTSMFMETGQPFDASDHSDLT
jgi:hypothetical protein